MKNILINSGKLHILKELMSIANELDEKGLSEEASGLDKIAYEIENKSEDKDDESEDSDKDEVSDDTEQKPLSKFHKMKMTRLVEEMKKNDFNNLSFEIEDYSIHIGRINND